ncbi:unnamed protein product [Paramecium octaurelia]|uniref:Uncharacterized protein n=1 Tax=Paramecium octaurelia TaxID=43137 RepID=A0A8S1SWF0_PAROT|nr:unnamed protein product [Paramecium octaurelia]
MNTDELENLAQIMNIENDRLQKQQNASVWTQQVCTIIFQSVYGLLFYLFSTTPGYYGDESSCIQLKKFSYILGAATLILVVIHTLLLIYSCSSKSISFLLSAEGVMNTVYGIFSLVIWIMLWIALAQKEECGSLTTLVWVFTILIILGVFLSCCLVCLAAVATSQK